MAKASSARKGSGTNAQSESSAPKASGENRPVHAIRYGGCEAAIWKKQREKGEFYSVSLRKSWRDKDGWHDGQTFLASDLPMLAKAITDAHSWVAWQERQAKKTSKAATESAPTSAPRET